MARRKQYGDFGDAFGLDEPEAHKYPPLAKSNDELTVADLEKMATAIEILESWSPERLSRQQLFRIQTRAGLAHTKLQKAIDSYINPPKEVKMNKIALGNAMDDAGLDDDTQPVIPTVGTKEKFTKVKKELDAFGDEIKK